MLNPYGLGEAVFEDGRFVDRDDELKALHGYANSKVAKAIVSGPRRFGKSSLLMRFCQELDGSATPVVPHPKPSVPIYFEATKLTGSFSRVLGAICGEVCRGVCRHLCGDHCEGECREAGVPKLPHEIQLADMRKAVRACDAAVRSRFPDKRIVFCLDECEHLDSQSSGIVETIADAFKIDDFKICPLLVMAWGRPLAGMPISRSRAKILKDGCPVHELANFSGDDVSSLLELGQLHLDEEASSKLADLTAGHPLFLGAVCHYLFENCSVGQQASSAAVGAVAESLPLRLTVILKDLFDQVEQPARLVLWAIARLQEANTKIALTAVRRELATHGTGLALPTIEAVAERLKENLVLSPDYCVNAVIFLQWLTRHCQYKGLLDDGAGRQAFDRVSAAKEQIDAAAHASDVYEDAVPGLREAIDLDHSRLDARRLLGEVHEATGELDEAIDYYQAVWHHDPEGGLDALKRCLETRMRQVVGEDEERFRELKTLHRRVAPLDEAKIDELNRTSAKKEIETLLDDWQEQLEKGEYKLADTALRRLVSENINGWPQLAAERYASILESTTLQDASRLQFCIAAMRDAFPIIAEEVGDDEVEVSEEHYVLQYIQDPVELENVRQHLQRPWWAQTVNKLELVWQENIDLQPGLQQIPASVLRRLMNCCPSSHLDSFLDACRRYLPLRFPSALKHNAEDAARMAEVLLSGGDSVWQALWEHVDALLVEVIVGDDTEVFSRFFGAGPALIRSFVRTTSDSARHAKLRGAVNDLLEKLQHSMVEVESTGLYRAVSEWKQVLELSENACPGDIQVLESARELADKLLESLPQPLEEVVLSAEFTEVEDHGDLKLRNVPGGSVRRLSAYFRRQAVTVKVYRLRQVNETAGTLLREMWTRELRVLSDVATRRNGQGLTSLLHSYWDEKEQQMVVVTRRSTETLRDELQKGERSRLRRVNPDLWAAIASLIEALHTLHMSGMVHRSIKPENVYVYDGDQHVELALANFECCLDIRNFSGEGPWNEIELDSYAAPEMLQSWFGDSSGDEDDEQRAGENLRSDVFSLGLVLFEIFVRPLDRDNSDDFRVFQERGSYSASSQKEWLDGLRDEIDNRAQLLSHEGVSLLKRMLTWRIETRNVDLDEAGQTAALLALGANRIQMQFEDALRPPVLTTALNLIRSFLKDDGVEDAALGDSAASVARFLEQDLAGATIHANGWEWSRESLVIVGARCNYVARPYKSRHHKAPYREIPYFVVEKAGDRVKGRALAKLPDSVEVVDVHDVENAGQFNSRKAGGLHTWKPLFKLVSAPRSEIDGLARKFHSVMGLSAEVERLLWDSYVVPYKVVPTPDGSPTLITDRGELVCIEDTEEAIREGRPRLAMFVAQQQMREQHEFELGSNSSPVAHFDKSHCWTVEKVEKMPDGDDADKESVSRQTRRRVLLLRDRAAGREEVPARGFLRPTSLQGNRAIFLRRKDVLRRLEDDLHLLQSVTRPLDKTYRRELDELRYHNRKLDTDKKRIVKSFLGTEPLFVLQGPPGTGKTTLAAEVVQQFWEQSRSMRVLVTSQANEPLNNLLETIDAAFSKHQLKRERAEKKRLRGKEREPLAIRLASQRFLDRLPEARDNLAHKYHPDNRARDYLRQGRQTIPSSAGKNADLVSKWHAFIDEQGESLVSDLSRRVKATANLVFATANDRSLHQLPVDQDFDLLIYEEAAKANPLEVLGPMLRSRKWLLIGDQNQLPPFQHDEFVTLLQDIIREATVLRGEAEENGWRPSHDGAAEIVEDRLRSQYGLAASVRLREILSRFGREDVREYAGRCADFFEFLHNHVDRDKLKQRGRDFADTLKTQWRMHPHIGTLVGKVYYHDVLKNGHDDGDEKYFQHALHQPDYLRDQHVVWIDMPHEDTPEEEKWSGERRALGGGYRNPGEVAVIHELMRSVRRTGPGAIRNIMLLSPYRAQVDLLNKMFFSWNPSNPSTGDLRDKAITVDSAQGRQAEIVVVSLVRNNPHKDLRQAFGFLANRNRSAVMFSRAESLLVIVGCSRHFANHPSLHINKVIEHIQAEEKKKRAVWLEADSFMQIHHFHKLRRHDDRNEQLEEERDQFDQFEGQQ